MFRGILPKEYGFYDYFEKHAAMTILTCKELVKMASEGGNTTVASRTIKDYEHELDKITHQCVEALHKTFITPIERNDIHTLIKRMDDIVDSIDAAVLRMALYEITEVRSDVKDIAEVLLKAAIEIEKALKGLRNIKNSDYIKEKCIAIREFESEGDLIFRQALSNLFKETDAILVIKWKEIYERFEKAVDRCEDVANIIESIVITSS
ncbi:MAG: ykaA [Ignavibacteria bacterium]|nr:ykaA [Ignavibacteria bacterium]